SLHLGTRRYRYVEYRGIDGLRERTIVSLGLFAGVSVGKGFGAFTPDGVSVVDDVFGRAHASFGAAMGSSLLHGGFTVESRRDGGDWQDILSDADLVAYLRNDGLQAHTVFVRASVAGGWRTRLPFQLALGGRQGVRSLAEDRFPGARMMRFVVEDRVLFPWPRPGAADLGMTVFADMGRVWPGDVPYAVDSGWQAALGAGLRIGLPAGTRNIVRADIAFPVGNTDGSPIFRMSFELNRLRDGFFTADVFRSRRFNLGAEHF
ncbi:MAG: BamA/TamA family outer membrane protein, partial [Gemmatimonadetes bacterium]|nr:outer membrane protein assembly factor [Gemmatimonadota bacterium]NNL30504.1 BamA/TamA family outer membrane protein [Gemmatimonadota bacterium]